MMLPSTALQNPAGLAFDTLAERYDDMFTNSLIGRAQRDAVSAPSMASSPISPD
jgi:hypothetical protein